jgi:hypothetical protein
MDAYITKPLEPTRLEETLRSHIQGQEKDCAYNVPVAGEMRFDPSRLEALRVMGGDESPSVARIVGSFVDGVDAALSNIRGVAASGDPRSLRAWRTGSGGAPPTWEPSTSASCASSSRREDAQGKRSDSSR